MAERKGMFRFVMQKDIVIATKRLLSSLALQHVNQAVALSNRTFLCVNDALLYLRKLDQIEIRVLETGLLDDETDEREDLRIVREALEHLVAAQKLLGDLRLRKIAAGVALEEALDPIYAPPPGPKATPSDPAKPIEPTPAQPITMQLVEKPVEVVSLSGADTPLVVKFDPDLLEKARRELAGAAKAKELSENEF